MASTEVSNSNESSCYGGEKSSPNTIRETFHRPPVSPSPALSPDKKSLLGDAFTTIDLSTPTGLRAASIPTRLDGFGLFSSAQYPLFGWIWFDSPYSGLACMALSSLSYSLMSLVVKLLTVRRLPCFQTLLIRSIVISCLSGSVLKRANVPLFGSPSQWRLMFLRSFIGFIAVSSFFYSLQVLNLSDAIVLNFTSPIFTALFAKFILKEGMSIRDLIGTIISFLGVIMIANPSLFLTFLEVYLHGFYPSKSENFQFLMANSEYDHTLGVIIALLAASTGGIAFCLVRFLGIVGEHPLVTVFTFATFTIPSSSVLLLLFQKPILLNFLEFIGTIFVGLFAFIGQIFLTRGLQLEKAGRATSMKYIKVFATYLFGLLFLHEVPSLASVSGAILIISSSIFIVLSKPV